MNYRLPVFLFLLSLPMALFAQGTNYGTNLILNPGAETGSLEHWTVTTPNTPFVKPWNNVGELANLASPMPEAEFGTPGDYYFMGGHSGQNTSFYQDVNLSFLDWSHSDEQYFFHASAWLGGWDTQQDHANVRFDFISGGAIIESYTLPTVTEKDRNNVTMFIYRSTDGSIPFGAESVRITVDFIFVIGGYDNDAYVDNLVFSVVPMAIPEASTWVLLAGGLMLSCAVLTRLGRRR